MDIQKQQTKQTLLSRRYILWIFGGMIFVVTTIVLLNLDKAVPSVSRSELWIGNVENGDMLHEVRASGTLIPEDIRWITTNVTATVEKVMVRPGANVDTNTIMVHLSSLDVHASLEQAQADFSRSEANVKAKQADLELQLLNQQFDLSKIKATYEIAKVRAEALTKAHESGIVAAIDLKESQITLEQDKHLVDVERNRLIVSKKNFSAQILAVEAERDIAASALSVAQKNANSLEIKPSITGIVQQVVVEHGQRVSAGDNIARVAKPRLIAVLKVPETQAKVLDLNLPVLVDTHNGIVEGYIAHIDPAVTEGRVTIDVILPDDLPQGVRPELSVNGRIVLDTLLDVVSIPRPALATEHSVNTLFVIASGSNVARRQTVEYGISSSTRIEVKKGLNPGDSIILSDASQWNNNDTLEIH